MKKITLLTVLLSSFLLAISQNSFAMNLSQAMSQLGTAKSQGLVGEQPDGYLGVVKNQNNAQSIVKLINQARKQQYQKLAAENQLDLPQVEALAGKKALQKTAPGHYIQINGNWVKK